MVVFLFYVCRRLVDSRNTKVKPTKGYKLSCFSPELRVFRVVVDHDELYRLVAENVSFLTYMLCMGF